MNPKFLIPIYFILLTFLPSLAPLHSQPNETVMFNVQTHKYHNPTCPWAIKCTRNCIPIKKSEAIQRGGVACKVCAG